MLICPVCGERFKVGYHRYSHGATLIPSHEASQGNVDSVGVRLQEILDSIQVLTEVKAEDDEIMDKIKRRMHTWN